MIIVGHPLAIVWEAVSVLVLIRCIMSWTRADPSTNGFAGFIFKTTEPLLAPIRRLLPPMSTGGLDFSPLLLLVIGGYVVRLVIGLF